jgi:Family of unknown function (DUF6235)
MDRRYRRLSKGLRCLEAWSKNAGQIEKNAAYTALFAVSNGSVSRFYRVSAAPERADEFIIHVRDDLVIKIRLQSAHAFGIEYIGPPNGVVAADQQS